MYGNLQVIFVGESGVGEYYSVWYFLKMYNSSRVNWFPSDTLDFENWAFILYVLLLLGAVYFIQVPYSRLFHEAVLPLGDIHCLS